MDIPVGDDFLGLFDKKNYYHPECYSQWIGCYVFFSTSEGTPVNCKSLVTLRNREPAGG